MFSNPSYYAKDVDLVMLFIVVVSILLFLGTTGTMVYFVFKYNKKKNPVPVQIEEKTWLEITWTIVPVILVLIMFFYGSDVFISSRIVPQDAMVVKVIGRMWEWSFTYPNGKTSDSLYLPVDRDTKLEMTTADVIHSLFIPAFRLKMDIIPGGKYYMVIKPDKLGEYSVLCAEYCGLNHSQMTTVLRVINSDEFYNWLNIKQISTDSTISKSDTSKATASNQESFKLLNDNGCLRCHSTDGEKKLGPSFATLSKGETSVVSSGKKRLIKIDDEYLKRSIIDPNADIVEGYFPDTMPSFKDKLNEKELKELVMELNKLKMKNGK